MADQDARLNEYLERLRQAARPRSVHEAFGLVTFTLNQVEDELSGVRFDLIQSSGQRMYPALWDRTELLAGGHVWRCVHRRHRTFLGVNGAIKIVKTSPDGEAVLYNEPGEDGRRVDDL